METPSSQPSLTNGIISIAPTTYINALLVLHRKLEGRNVDWAVGGDLGEVLRTVNVEPDCIEIQTSEEGAEKIVEATSEFNPHPVTLEVQRLPRNVVINGKEYPVYIRSYNSEFNIDAVKVKVLGDLQYRIDVWDWGDKVEFTPEYVYVVGKKIAVVPLPLKLELYQMLGWGDRAEKIKQTLDKRRMHGR